MHIELSSKENIYNHIGSSHSNNTEWEKTIEKINDFDRSYRFDSKLGKAGPEFNKLHELSQRFYPCIEKGNKIYPVLLQSLSLKQCFDQKSKLEKHPLDDEFLEVVKEFKTIHRHASSKSELNPPFFRPSIGEVLNQIPVDIMQGTEKYYYATRPVVEVIIKNNNTIFYYDLAITTLWKKNIYPTNPGESDPQL